MDREEKFLIVETSYLGDVILSTVLAEAIHRQFPNAAIDYVIKKGNEILFDDHPFIRNVLTFDKKQRVRQIVSLLGKIRSEKYTYLINTHRYASSGFLSVFSGAKNIIGYTANPFSFGYTKSILFLRSDGRHAIARYVDLIKHFIHIDECSPRLYIQEHAVEEMIKPYICISPCSRWNTKMLDYPSWVRFINQIPNDTSVYLLGGKLDFEYLEKIRKLSSREVVNSSLSWTFLESVYVMKNAAMNYVLDSAPLHMASAVNAPVVSVFLSTSPTYGFGPLSENQTIIQSPLDLPCKPCGPHGHKACPKGHFKCSQIVLEDLINSLPIQIKNHLD